MKPITKISTAVSAGVLAVCAMASTAEASTTKAIGLAAVSVKLGPPPMDFDGRCTASRGNYGEFKAQYAILPSGARSFYRFTWYLGGPGLRSKSNVSLRIWKDLWKHSDIRLWGWDSADNVAAGSGGYTLPWAFVTRLTVIYAQATFVFDRSGIDPRCTANSKTSVD